MSSELTEAPRGEVTPSFGPVRRLGSAIGIATISVMDLLALEDITTAGAWMPEALFLIASIPALITLVDVLMSGRARRSEPGTEAYEGRPPA